MVILFGLKGVGKSSVGRLLAQSLEKEWIDTDFLVAERAGKSCREIVLSEGEQVFRSLEKQAVKESALRDSVVSLGGSTLLDRENVSLLSSRKKIYLRCAIGTLVERLDFKNLPAFIDWSRPKEHFIEMMVEREALFVPLADEVVETDGCPVGEVVKRVLEVCVDK